VLSREVAIKVLNSELADTALMERFRREAVALAKLNHPGIATIYELFPSETDLLMVMEFVRGETLDRISDRMGALPPEHAAYLVDKILSALEHAHHAGIVHRDMKPANVMITDGGGMKLLDFGVARMRAAEHEESYMVGTPAYMSPEQVRGRQVDGRADLYSVGIIFYRLLTGTLPFTSDTAIGMLEKQILEAPTPLHVHREGLPDWCEPVLQRALAKLPADRFQSAEEFREAIGMAAGIAATELTKALSICVADADVNPPPQPNVVERFGHTVMERAASGSGSVDASPSDATSRGAKPMSPHATIADGAASVVAKKRARLRGLVRANLVGAITVLAILAVWRPAVAPIATVGDVAETSQVRVTGRAPATATTAPQASAHGSGALPSAPAPSSLGVAPLMPVVNRLAVPFAFEAKMLIRDGDRQRERECQVVLANGTITIHAKDGDSLLHAVPYDGILSISYSRGRDPLWNAASGSPRVVRAVGRALGFLRGARYWVSLRINNPNPEFVVLRLNNHEQATRAITALEERTGRTGEIVLDRNDKNSRTDKN
jgi:hypothetical protein